LSAEPARYQAPANGRIGGPESSFFGVRKRAESILEKLSKNTIFSER